MSQGSPILNLEVRNSANLKFFLRFIDIRPLNSPISEFWFRRFKSFEFASLITSGAIYVLGRGSNYMYSFWFRRFKSFEWCDIWASGAIWAWLELPVFRMPNKVVCEPSFRCSNFRFIRPSKFLGASREDFNAQLWSCLHWNWFASNSVRIPVCGWMH